MATVEVLVEDLSPAASVSGGESFTVQVAEAPASGIDELVAGDNVTIDNTDPRRPIISTPDPGGGAVDSVNGQTGIVVLDAIDVGAATTAQGTRADTAVQPVDLADEVTRADAAYDAIGAAAVVQAVIDAHLADSTAAHSATAISFTPTGSIAASDVQSAVAEVASEAAAAVASEATARDAAITAAIAALVNSAPGVLDTLDEIAAALGDDPNFAATITTALAGKQPLDAELSAVAALTSSANKLPYFSGSGTASLADFTAFARTLLDDADAATMRGTLGLDTAATHPATDFQAADAELSAIAGLTSAADKAPYFTGSGAAALMTVSSFIRTLLDDADAASALATLGAAPLASPALTGNPTAPTASPGDNDTSIATTAFVAAAVAAGGGGGGSWGLNPQSTSYTAVLSDASKVIVMSNAVSATVTIPANASVAFPNGTEIEVALTGIGPLIIAGASGVTISNYASIKLIRPGDTVRLIKIGTNAWAAIGGWLPTYTSVVLADSPLAFYRFSETSGTTLNDLSGNGHNGTYGATKTPQAGLLNDDSDGATAQYASVASASWMNVNSIAIECLLKVTADPTNSGIAARFNAANDWLLWFDTGGKLAVRFYNASASSVDIPWSIAPTLGVKYRVFAQYTSGAASLWVNGELVGFKDTLTGNLAQGATDLDIRSYQGSGHNAPIVLDELGLYGNGDFNERRIALHTAAA